MSLLYIAILALVQGITEFLPVSSSGHLLLTHALFEGPATQGAWKEDLIMDLAVHVGSLLAVLLYFRKDILKMLAGVPQLAAGNLSDPGARLALYLAAASVPALIVGYTLHKLQPGFLRSVEIVAWCTLVYGILLWFVDTRAPVRKAVKDITLKEAVLIGCAQALALVPGTSRSGITMTAARALGFSRAEAAHFSFLLSIIATAAAGAVGALDLLKADSIEMTVDAGVAAGFSFLASWTTIAFLMKWLRTWTFTPFAVYRVVLGALLLVLIYSGALGDIAAMTNLVAP